MNAENLPKPSPNANEQTLTVARQAFDYLKKGFMDGDFEPYFAMLTDDYTFCLPMEPARGEHRGIGKAREYYRMSKETNSWLDLGEPFSVAGNEKTVIFEFEVNGKIAGADFHNRVAIALDILGDKISGFREYIGDIAPNFIAELSAKQRYKKLP